MPECALSQRIGILGENLAAALTRLKRLVIAVRALDAKAGGAKDRPRTTTWRDRLDDAISDDLNTARALPLLDDMLADKTLTPAERMAVLTDFDDVLGLNLVVLDRRDLRLTPTSAAVSEAEIETSLAERREARAAKDFARSDAIRNELGELGVEVMDGDPLGWDWRLSI